MFNCQEPPQEIPPMTKVMQKRPDRQGRSGLEGPPNLLEHLPQNQNLSTVYYIMPFTNSSVINRVYPRPPFSLLGTPLMAF